MSVLKKRSLEDNVIDFISYGFLIILLLAITLPFMQVVTISFSPSNVVNTYGFHLIPRTFDLGGYKTIFTNDSFLMSYLVTIARTIIGTACCVMVTTLTAFPLSRINLPYRKPIMMFIVFTMYFNGGMIPTYLVIKNIGLTNNFLVYILPCLITGFALIVTRNFFMGLPPGLEESAKIDGASNMTILLKIYMPLSLPVISTISLWYGVTHWNSWMDNLLYVTNKKMYVLQYVLQNILISGQTKDMELPTDVVVHTQTMKMAALVLSLIPIVSTYPFFQRYFVKGTLVGSVKG